MQITTNKIQPSKNYQEDNEKIYSNEKQQGTNKGSILTAYFNIICLEVGTGAVGLPSALSKSGWISILILFLAYSMAVYSGTVLIRCLYHKPDQRLDDMKQVGKAAFGRMGYFITCTLSNLILFGCPALYLVLAAGNITTLLEGTSAALTRPVWTIIIGVFLLIPLLIMKTLRDVTLISTIGMICTLMAVFIIIIESPLDALRHTDRIVHHDIVIWSGFPSSLAIIAFSFGGMNTYPHIEQTLKKKSQWSFVLAAGLSTCTIFYLLTSISAYIAYGDKATSPIYHSLPPGTGQTISIVVTTIQIILAMPLSTTTFSLEFEKATRVTEDRLGALGCWVARAVIRSFTMLIIILLAIFIPYFDHMMMLLGAIACCGLEFIIPVSCYLKLTGIKGKPFYELFFCFLTIVMGIVGLCIGTKDAIMLLVEDFKK